MQNIYSIDDEINAKKKLEKAFLKYNKQMKALAFSYLHQHDDSEDVVSMIFLRILEKNWSVVCEIKNENNLRNYLLKATKNTALNILNERKKYVFMDFCPDYIFEENYALSDDKFFDKVFLKVECENIIQIIKQLDEKYSRVLYYHFILEYTLPQTAELLNQPISTTKKQLQRGRKQLINILQKKGIDMDNN